MQIFGVDTSVRSEQLELMDDVSLQGEELEKCLRELSFINTSLGGVHPTVSGVFALLPEDCKRFTLLDIGTGSADLPRHIVKEARRRGIEVRITAIDLSDTTIATAKKMCSGFPEIELRRVNLFDLPASEPFDIVHAALLLHHFSIAEAPRALRKMYELSRYGVVLNDLHRHIVAWLGIRILTQAFSRNRFIRNDGPLSVLRAFSRDDLERMAAGNGMPAPELKWLPMFRWRALFRKAGG